MKKSVEQIKEMLVEIETKDSIKKILKEEIRSRLNEDTNYVFNHKGKKYSVKFDVNNNDTKKGIKIQFLPIGGSDIAMNPQAKQSLSSELQVVLNQKLASMGLTVDFDTDVPYKDVIGYTLKLGTLSQMIINALQQPTPPPSAAPAPVPSAKPAPAPVQEPTAKPAPVQEPTAK
jgi:hypothetical protein